MVDNLPLIPDKQGVCADVRPVLREVFRELDYLPPLATEERDKLHVAGDADISLPSVDHWVDKYKSGCKQIWQREGELKQHRAMTISRKPLPNIYKLHAPRGGNDNADWKKRHGILERKDLIPSIEQNAGRSASLWIKNILNRSSCEVSSVTLRGSRVRPPLQLQPRDEVTLQSMSIGEVYEHHPAPPTPPPPEIPQPEYILCVPPRLDFINFTIGQLHTQGIRLINVSKFEIRLSIRPPVRKELDIELGGTRGLTVTSGAAAEIRVHFRPRDVRVVIDQLLVRVSAGRNFAVPIACFMQPPILEILVPSITSSMLTCTPGDIETCEMMSRSSDVLELGARLLGDVHLVKMLLHCEAEHAELFVLTENDWLSFCLDDLSADGSVVSGGFSWWPARWAGGGAVRAAAACRARSAGLHTAPLRLLASTAVARPLHLLADALMFATTHITIQAQEKDYDICSEDDPACEYFVHLGTAFPGRSLTATILLVNHSPVLYTYYWTVRPWGVCSCWEEERGDHSGDADDDSERLCVGAQEAKARNTTANSGAEEAGCLRARRVRVEPAGAVAAPRSSRAVHVAAPDVGTDLGTQRAVLMLVLKDIPKESFPPDYEPMVISSKTVDSEPIPGFRRWKREVCDVVCCQLEVWWEVAPLRFVLDPPVLPIYHSKRVQHVDVLIRATQLFGCEGVRGAWCMPSRCGGAAPPAPRLTPANSCAAKLPLTLPPIHDHSVETDVIALVAANDEWKSLCEIWRQCAGRHLSLRPGFHWLGIVPPGTHMSATLDVHNDTYQEVEWRCSAYRWVGENEPRAVCATRAPCARCLERACSCALLVRDEGRLPHAHRAALLYDVNAPERDGCVCTVVRAYAADAAQEAGEASAGASSARGAALAYRVLAPTLLLRVLPCRADGARCEGCKLDPGELCSERGAATLRPRRALALAHRSCYRLRLINITPLPTYIRWEPALEGEDILKVTFTPNQVDIASYGEVEIQVVLEALKVCRRRVFVYRALVDHAYKPLYLLIDAAIAGLEVVCEVPIGGALHPDAIVALRRTQRECRPGEALGVTSLTPADIFSQEDQRRDEQKESRCQCPFEMVYVPPVKRPEPPPPEDYTPPVEIVEEPPALTRVCPCCCSVKPLLPDHYEPICLQFRDLPLRTVRSRRLVIRNESSVSARWSSAVRRWPRVHSRTLHAGTVTDRGPFHLNSNQKWVCDVRAPGVRLQCSPARGALPPRSAADVLVSVYAACWGLYRDQILIHVLTSLTSLTNRRFIDDVEIVRCLNCQQYGHVHKFCTIKTPTCAVCAEAHETKACPHKDNRDFKPVCATCKRFKKPHDHRLEEPPALTRVCPCCCSVKPLLPDHYEPICLQFRDLPLRTVRSRRLVIRNESSVSARWSSAVRRWPRVHSRTLHADQWVCDVRAPGVRLQCSPARGALPPRSAADVLVSVYAACWGLYRDQILIHVEGVEPVVLDVWVQAVGVPLHFAISSEQEAQTDSVLWCVLYDC
ncbi:uncharacterized protein LOC115442940 [Manduca sexta]|uniref:uncharacterized protein LOC115442940 n=1 Tax=Manduca sexta TaxID=7130 RepID=UPI00188E3585|nr:uncharacterized protein LOC115442940 [Manduca sexta]